MEKLTFTNRIKVFFDRSIDGSFKDPIDHLVEESRGDWWMEAKSNDTFPKTAELKDYKGEEIIYQIRTIRLLPINRFVPC